MRILYEVSVTIELSRSEEFENYMRRTHIPEVLGSGCFSSASFAKAEDGEYRTSYRAKSRDSLNRYLESYAGRLRDDFVQHFPEAKVTRSEFEELDRLGA